MVGGRRSYGELIFNCANNFQQTRRPKPAAVPGGGRREKISIGNGEEKEQEIGTLIGLEYMPQTKASCGARGGIKGRSTHNERGDGVDGQCKGQGIMMGMGSGQRVYTTRSGRENDLVRVEEMEVVDED